MKKAFQALAVLSALFLLGAAGEPDPPAKYTLSEVHPVAGRQGVCTEGGVFWVSGSATLTKYDSEWNVIAKTPIPLRATPFR